MFILFFYCYSFFTGMPIFLSEQILQNEFSNVQSTFAVSIFTLYIV